MKRKYYVVSFIHKTDHNIALSSPHIISILFQIDRIKTFKNKM